MMVRRTVCSPGHEQGILLMDTDLEGIGAVIVTLRRPERGLYKGRRHSLRPPGVQRRIAGKGPDHLFLLIDDEIKFESQPCQAAGIHDLFVEKIAIHQVDLAVSMAHPVKVMVRDGTIRRDSGQKNLAAPPKPAMG